MVSELCKLAEVSRSGYYGWLDSEEARAEREEQDRKDYQLIRKVYENKKGQAGAKIAKMNLENNSGIVMNFMNKFDLIATVRRPKASD